MLKVKQQLPNIELKQIIEWNISGHLGRKSLLIMNGLFSKVNILLKTIETNLKVKTENLIGKYSMIITEEESELEQYMTIRKKINLQRQSLQLNKKKSNVKQFQRLKLKIHLQLCLIGYYTHFKILLTSNQIILKQKKKKKKKNQFQ